MNEKLMKQLAGVSVSELEMLLKQKRQESYQPLIVQYETLESEMETKLAKIKTEILAIDSDWTPKTNSDRIAEFITANPKVAEDKLVEQFKNRFPSKWAVTSALKKGVEGGKWTVKEQLYSIVAK